MTAGNGPIIGADPAAEQPMAPWELRQKIDLAISGVAQACKIANEISRAGHPADRGTYQRLRAASIESVLQEARELERLTDLRPAPVKPGPVSGGARFADQILWITRQPSDRDVDENDGDARAEQKAADVAVSQADVSPRRNAGSGHSLNVGQQAVDNLEVVPVVAHAHENSSAVGAPGADDTGSLASTVEAPADSPSSSAGRGVGGWRPRGLLTRLRGRPSP